VVSPGTFRTNLVSCVVLGVVCSIILSVTDGSIGCGGDSSCGGGSCTGSSYVLLLFFYLLVCSLHAHDRDCSMLKFPFVYS
jgi:hypothetical protein